MTTTLSPTMGSALPDLGTPYSQRTVDIIRTLGPTRILGLASAVASVLAILIYVAVMVGTPDYDVLFAKLPVEASGAIVKKLEASGERYRLEDGGSTILVDKSNVARLRVMAAESKLISPGSLGYELLDRADTLTTTNSLFQVNRIRALEGELARTIAAVEGIESARVHLVIPMRELFSQSGQESRASIVLKATGDRTVSKRSVEAIQQIVAGSVRDLAAARVAIMDTKGNLLARGDGDAQSSVSAGVFERKMDFERRTREGIERMLEQYVGLGRVRADVTADFNLTSVSRSSETFDPRGRVERSIQTVEEAANRENTRQGRDVSVRNNIPEGQSATAAAAGQSRDVTNRTEETTNFEVSKSQTRETTEPGALTRLSVAVLVDGKYVGGDGVQPGTYEARSEQEIQQLTRLVRSLVGFSADRGDVVEIVNLPFATPDPKSLIDAGPLLSKQEILRLSQIGILALVALVIALFAVRPVLRALRPAEEDTETLEAPEGSTALVPVELDDVSQLKAEIEREMQDLESKRSAALADMIDIEKIEGQVQASAVKRITEIFDKHPDEAVSVMRNWLTQRA